MRQISGHDAHFLYADSNHANSNVTLIQIYDQSTAPGGVVRFKSILALIESRLDRSPLFRSKLLRVPLELSYPYWVEDESFDIENHVRHIALPKPGDWRQFCIQASRIHARPMDMHRPLWEIYVMEGLDSITDLPPGSFALLIKLHHAAVDVEQGSEISRLLHDLSPQVHPIAPPKPWFPEPAPGTLKLMLKGAIQSVFSPLSRSPLVVRAMTRAMPVAVNFAKDVLFKPELLTPTRFNSAVSPYRVFDTRRFRLDEFKAIRALVPGATLNDVVLAVCSGGLRRYLAAKDELPGTSLTAVAPVYVDSAGEQLTRNPHVAWLRIRLASDVANPLRRLRQIRQQTRASVAIAMAVRAAELTEVTEHMPSASLALASKLMAKSASDIRARLPLANCTITNVPGSPKALYLNGARMTYFSAIMPVTDGMGLVLTVTSYDGGLVISPTACRYLLPDPDFFCQCIRDSFQEYLALTQPARQPLKAASARGSASGTPKPRRRAAGKVASPVPAAPVDLQ